MILAFVAAAVAISCVQEEISAPETRTVVYSASLAGDASRAEMGVNGDGNPQSFWTDNDKITIHNGVRGFEFVTSLDAPSEDADFTYSGDDFSDVNGVIAVYPAGDYSVNLTEKTVSATVPTLQNAVPGSYDPKAAIAVAYSEGKSLTFRNLTAMLKFTVKDHGVKSVVFTGLADEKIENTLTAVLTEDGSGVDSVVGSGEGAAVTLSAAEAFVPGTTYYMAVAPQVLENGFTVHFQLSDGGTMYLAKTYEKACTLKRNVILNVGELACNLPELTDEDPVLNSMSFTVAANPGKILSRKFSHNSSLTLSTSSVTEEKCQIDQTKKKVTLYVPYLNDRKLVPSFSIPRGTTLINSEGEVIISGETEVDFVTTKQLTVINGKDEKAVYDIELTNTGLPVVVVNQLSGTTSTESDREYKDASNAWYAATGAQWQPKDADWSMAEGDNFMVYNADGTSALTNKSKVIVDAPILASTRLRGNVTQQMPKKSFAVKLDKKHGVKIKDAAGVEFEMLPHKRWVLLANWKDRTLTRNEVAFGLADVFKKTFPDDGMAWNPSGHHVELVYNGVYVGNYYLCEQIKIDGNRLDINEPLDEKDNPYNGDPSVFGYLLESDDGYDETWQFTTKCYIPFLLKDDANDDMLEYAQDFVRGIEDNLYKNTADGYTAAFAKMDLTSFVDFLLIQEIMMNSEMKHPKSCYSYINDGIMYAGPLWDFDWNTLPTSTSYSEEGFSYTSSMLSKASLSHSSSYPSSPKKDSDKNYIWYTMLVKNSTFKDLAKQRWDTVKASLISYVDNDIPKIQNKIATSEAENNKMWPVDSGSSVWGSKRYSKYGIGGGFCGDEGKSFSEAVSTMQSTLKTRINGMSYVSDKNWPNK